MTDNESKGGMGEVVDLDAQRPHCTGRVVCQKCGKTWVAVWPASYEGLMECPICSDMAGEVVDEPTFRQATIAYASRNGIAPHVASCVCRSCEERRNAVQK